MNQDSRIFIAGHRGLVGSALERALKKKGYTSIITRTRQELDLCNQVAVIDFFAKKSIEYVFLAAAKVGGIHANATYQADFLYENLAIATNVIRAAAQNGVRKLLFFGSSCIYPKLAEQPMREESLLTGQLEPTNEGYAIAKIAGLKLCEMYQRQYQKQFISVIPANLYGPGDNFHPQNSHVVPGMLRRFHEAKLAGLSEVSIWGSGQAKRDFLFVDDLVEAVHLVMQDYSGPKPLNIGSGQECSILELAQTIKEVVGYSGKLVFDSSKPDGALRKLLESGAIQKLGWKPKHSLKEGLAATYRWAVENHAFGRTS